MTLHDVAHCFEGLVPPAIVTVDADGVPNIVRLSKARLIDDRHFALTRQFFKKTAQNLAVHPYAAVMLVDPATYEGYIVHARFVRSETSGPTFDAIEAELDAIASLTGMQDVFALQAADVFEALEIMRGFDPRPGETG